jgi:hypothetical protein
MKEASFSEEQEAKRLFSVFRIRRRLRTMNEGLKVLWFFLSRMNDFSPSPTAFCLPPLPRT